MDYKERFELKWYRDIFESAFDQAMNRLIKEDREEGVPIFLEGRDKSVKILFGTLDDIDEESFSLGFSRFGIRTVGYKENIPIKEIRETLAKIAKEFEELTGGHKIPSRGLEEIAQGIRFSSRGEGLENSLSSYEYGTADTLKAFKQILVQDIKRYAQEECTESFGSLRYGLNLAYRGDRNPKKLAYFLQHRDQFELRAEEEYQGGYGYHSRSQRCLRYLVISQTRSNISNPQELAEVCRMEWYKGEDPRDYDMRCIMEDLLELAGKERERSQKDFIVLLLDKGEKETFQKIQDYLQDCESLIPGYRKVLGKGEKAEVVHVFRHLCLGEDAPKFLALASNAEDDTSLVYRISKMTLEFGAETTEAVFRDLYKSYFKED
jgi:hypothetical protein